MVWAPLVSRLLPIETNVHANGGGPFSIVPWMSRGGVKNWGSSEGPTAAITSNWSGDRTNIVFPVLVCCPRTTSTSVITPSTGAVTTLTGWIGGSGGGGEGLGDPVGVGDGDGVGVGNGLGSGGAGLGRGVITPRVVPARTPSPCFTP